MQTFDESLMDLIQKDLITKKEALYHCSNIRDFQMRLEGIVSGDWREKDNNERTRAVQIKEAMEEDNSPIEIEGIDYTGTED